MARPIDMHNTWTNAYDLRPGSAEGWVRSIYSRGLLAYFDGTGDLAVLAFLAGRFHNYTAQDSTSDRSLTQIEALLEGHAYGGPRSMADTALGMMQVLVHISSPVIFPCLSTTSLRDTSQFRAG